VFVNDLDSDVVNRVWKFTDDVNMIGNVGTVKGVREFREDLTRMEKWTKVWQMGFIIIIPLLFMFTFLLSVFDEINIYI